MLPTLGVQHKPPCSTDRFVTQLLVCRCCNCLTEHQELAQQYRNKAFAFPDIDLCYGSMSGGLNLCTVHTLPDFPRYVQT